METEGSTTDAPRRTHWATASFVLSLAGWVCAALIYCNMFYELLYDSTPLFLCAPLCWAFALVFGIVALVAIRRKRPLYTGTVEAITGIGASAIPLILIAAISILFYLALRGEPYDESHPEAVISIIEENCDIEFPAKMESLKAADRIAPGIDKPYHFVVSFTTNMNNFAELKESISQLDSYFEERVERDPNVGKYTPADFAVFRDSPEWYKTEIPKGEIHESSGVSKNNKIRLRTIWINLPESEKVVVYMEGWGDSRLKQDKK